MVGRTGENSGREKDERHRKSISLYSVDPVISIISSVLLETVGRKSIVGGSGEFVGLETIVR